MDNAIEIINFSKSFDGVKVIDNLSFEVRTGEIFAFLGANGSGKTTTIRALLNIYKPDQGKLLVFGKPYTPECSHLVGYLPEERGLYVNSKVIDVMVYLGQLKGLSQDVATRNALQFLERVDLLTKKNAQIKQLSGGQQQKIQLGITLINQPKLLILDEPTKGLDPINRNLMLEILTELNSQNQTTILFSTHLMEEVEKIATRLLMIKNGKQVLYGNLNQVKNSFGINTIRLRFSGNFIKNDKLFTSLRENNYVEITPLNNITVDQILKHLINTDIIIHEIQIGAPSLNDIFIKVTENND